LKILTGENYVDIKNTDKIKMLFTTSTPDEFRIVPVFIEQSLELRKGDPKTVLILFV